MKVVTGTQMQALDRRTIEAGTPGVLLMERAGAGAWLEAARFIARLDPRHARRLVVLAGKGNNGGDGYVLARHAAAAAAWGRPVAVYSTCAADDLSGDALAMAKRLPPGVALTHIAGELPADALQPGDVVVDALLGTGVRGAAREPVAAWIRAVNASGLPVVALDLPSGLEADTGAAAGDTVRADLTVTFGLPKVGHLSADGPAHTGSLRVVDIGIPAAYVAELEAALEATVAADVAPLVGRLPHNAYKGSQGRILVLGGSARFPGAPLLTGTAALRAGGGLVSVAYPLAIGGLLGVRPNALILAPLPDNQFGYHNPAGAAELRRLVDGQDVLVIGPGLGRMEDSMTLARGIQSQPVPMVVDADGLWLLAQGSFTRPRNSVTVLTPHPGEMEVLLRGLGKHDLVRSPRHEQALCVAAMRRVFVVLKGPQTLVASPDGQWAINTSGSAALASGGSGDVLAGIIAACLHGAPDPYAAVRLGVFLHGLAAELSPRGMRATIADDIPDLLGAAWRELSPFA